MTKQAWFCPACQRHHAPHVDTCPGEQTVAPLGPLSPPYVPYMPPIYTVPTWQPAPIVPPFEITCGTLIVPNDPNMMVIN